MSQYITLHPDNPQPRLVKRCCEIIRGGGVVVYPTDSSYALGCAMDNKNGLERVRRIRKLEEDHNFTLVCASLSQVSSFARIDNESFRLIKTLTPGAFTFILSATRETPKRLQHSKRKTIGIRLPDDPVTEAIVAELDEPLFSSTLQLPGEDQAMSDPEEIRDRLGRDVDLIIDAGIVACEPTTIIDLTGSTPEIIRQGKGIADNLRSYHIQ